LGGCKTGALFGIKIFDMQKTFILSDSSETNSYGFKVNLEGLNIDRFRENPVMLFNHDSRNVIGRWNNVRTEAGRLLAEAEFDTDDALGKEVSRKVEKGYLKGCSAGLLIKKMAELDAGLTVTESELLEASIVAVPADAGAVALYDENRHPVTLDVIKLKFNLNNSNQKKMEPKFELTAPTLTSLGLTAGATATQVEMAVAAKDTKIAALTAKVQAFEKAKVTDLIAAAIAAKKIGADEKETYTALAEKDFESVEKILAKMQGVAPINGQLSQKTATDKYAGKSWDELDRAGLLVSLKADAPELYSRLYEEKFSKFK
jgi:HK97 family phage prohead protease